MTQQTILLALLLTSGNLFCMHTFQYALSRSRSYFQDYIALLSSLSFWVLCNFLMISAGFPFLLSRFIESNKAQTLLKLTLG